MAEANPPNLVAGGSGTDCVSQNQNVIKDKAAQNTAAQLAQQILANTNVMLKQEKKQGHSHRCSIHLQNRRMTGF